MEWHTIPNMFAGAPRLVINDSAYSLHSSAAALNLNWYNTVLRGPAICAVTVPSLASAGLVQLLVTGAEITDNTHLK